MRDYTTLHLKTN